MGQLDVQTFQFQFANGRDFRFVLRGVGGEILDDGEGSGQLIEPGVSLVRSLEGTAQSWVSHSQISEHAASPGRCSNMALYEDHCMLPEPFPMPPVDSDELIFDPEEAQGGAHAPY